MAWVSLYSYDYVLVFFFFKQKTAYEMRISDWSSDVCSSDLTSFVGSLDAPAPDIQQRLALAIVGRSPVARQLAFARERGWTPPDFYQTVGSDFARGYNVLVDRDDGSAVLIDWMRVV